MNKTIKILEKCQKKNKNIGRGGEVVYINVARRNFAFLINIL